MRVDTMTITGEDLAAIRASLRASGNTELLADLTRRSRRYCSACGQHGHSRGSYDCAFT